MDRGTVCIDNLPLTDYVHHFFSLPPPRSASLVPLVRTLFRLELTWYTGTASASDTLLSCILLHRDPAFVSRWFDHVEDGEFMVLALEGAMAIASLVASLTSSSSVCREEDFHHNLYGMNWWSPACGFNFVHEFSGSHLKRLLDRLLQAAVSLSESHPAQFFFARYYVRKL